jgi:DNA-binding MarR family transcriptional regulator
MPASAAKRDRQLRSEIWRTLYDLFLEEHERTLESAAELGVSPGDLKALMRLLPGQGASMRELAGMWRCDASTVTWIVDRLEKQGLAERRAHESDRRVKVVALTGAGEQLRSTLLDRLYEPPAALSTLSPKELSTLRALAARMKTGQTASER